jgi:uncharacterized protein (DUF1501 family)
MTIRHEHFFTRRLFLQRGVALASISATAPLFLQRTGFALTDPSGATSSRVGVPEERVLVVVQLSGGNDGLNTVIPFENPAYHRARPGIGLRESDVLRFDKRTDVALHPNLTGLAALHDDGMLCLVQGVGYPNPNRSHFASMDIWHTASDEGVREGWLGRFFDNECSGQPGGCAPTRGIAIGDEEPLAMQGRIFRPVSFENANDLRWEGGSGDDALARAHDAILNSGAGAGEDDAAFLMRTALDARVAGDSIRAAASAPALVEYPRNPLAQQLQVVASMIRAGMPTRVYYVTLGGFDTHAGQGGAQGRHANLMQQLGDSAKAFYDDLRASEDHVRVMTMVFSEFGRRVAQNASGGTDHGAAAPMFLLGPMVRPGVLGRHPSLTDLDDGDLKFGVDFRSVYSAVLADWLKTDVRAALGRSWATARVVR